MNCVISGSAGLAFLIDGKRAFLLRVSDNEPVPSSPFHFHRLFSEVRDCIFLEGTDIPRARARLKRASTASDSLSLALRLLDGTFEPELRTEIAADLKPLLRERDAKDDLAAVLAAAPFPPDMDLPGALTACESAGAREVASLLTELRECQQIIREVRQAWDAIPDELFGDAERRRDARAHAVRGGLFLRIVRARACGDRLENVLVEALADRSVSRWMPGQSNVLKVWIQTWVSTDSGVQSEAIVETVPPNEDLPQVRRRERRRSQETTRSVSRSPGTRELVREAIDKFVGELGTAHERGTRAVGDLVKRTRSRIHELQGSRPEDRPHFAKSLSNMATSLRDVGEEAASLDLLEWAWRRRAVDAVSYGALVDAYGKAGDLARAEEVFEAARAAGLADAVTYLIWFAAVARRASARRIAAAIELIVTQHPPDRPVARTLAGAIAWAAGRYGRPDWLERLPDASRSASALFAFAFRTTDVDGASTLMSQYGTRAAAATMLLRYRRLGATASATDISAVADECRRLREGIGSLDAFTLVQLTEIEARCLRRVERWTEVWDRWASCEHLVVPRIETRATLLAESGCALLVLGLRRGDTESAREGAHRLLNGWSFARLLNPADPEALLASAQALGGFALAKEEVSRSPNLAPPVRAILAEGARDGRWTSEAVEASDLPDDYLLPALRGIKFLHEMKEDILRGSSDGVC